MLRAIAFAGIFVAAAFMFGGLDNELDRALPEITPLAQDVTADPICGGGLPGDACYCSPVAQLKGTHC